MKTVREARVNAARDAIKEFNDSYLDGGILGGLGPGNIDVLAARVVDALFPPNPLIDNAHIGE